MKGKISGMWLYLFLAAWQMLKSKASRLQQMMSGAQRMGHGWVSATLQADGGHLPKHLSNCRVKTQLHSNWDSGSQVFEVMANSHD